MFYINIWITSTFGNKFGHEYESSEDEDLLAKIYPNPNLAKKVMIDEIDLIFNKILKFNTSLNVTENFHYVTLFVSKIYNKNPEDILDKISLFFRTVAENYPSSYGTCHLFGDDPPLEREIVVVKAVGKIISCDKDPFFLEHLPKYVEPEE